MRQPGHPGGPAATAVLALLLLSLAAAALARLVWSETSTLGALVAGVAVQLLALAWPLIVAAAALGRWRLAVAAAGLAVLQLGLALPLVNPDERPPVRGPALRVVTANTYVLAEDPEATGRALAALRPDVLVVQELTRRGLDGLRAGGALAGLPHEQVELGDGGEGLGTFSRWPLTERRAPSVLARPTLVATVRVPGAPLRLLNAHPLPPVGPFVAVWRRQLRELGRLVRAEADGGSGPLPLVVAGDLNAGPGHVGFRRLLAEGLRDAATTRGRGLAGTWPSRLPVLALDHVLVSREVAVLDARRGPDVGSDHRPVVADLGLGGP